MAKENGWSKYEKLVLMELQDLKTDVGTVKTTLARLNTRLTVVEVKAGVWGALAGLAVALPTAVAVAKMIRP